MPNANLTKRGFFAALAATAVAPLLPCPALAGQKEKLLTQTSHEALKELSEVFLESPNGYAFVVMREFQGMKKTYVAGLEKVCGNTLYSKEFVFDPPIGKGEVFFLNSYGFNDL